MYLYQTIISKDPTSFKKADGSNQLSNADITAHQDAMTDFEANFKSSAVRIEGIQVAETVFTIEKSYVAFKTLVDGATIQWSDVKYVNGGTEYRLIIVTEVQL